METVFFNHALSDTAERRRQLRQALLAFIAEPFSRHSIHCIALFVRIPALSSVASLPVPPSPSQTQATAATGTTATTASSGQSAPGHSGSGPSHQRQGRLQAKMQWCAVTAAHRLAQAQLDARDVEEWIAVDSLNSSGRKRPNHRLRVVVAAYLEPKTVDDLQLFQSWQRCGETLRLSSSKGSGPSRTAHRYAPLRAASLICLSFGAPALLHSWAERRSSSLLSVDLENYLLSHQQLLLDFSWSLDEVLRRPRHGAMPTNSATALAASSAGTSTGAAKSDTHSVTKLAIFFTDVQPTLKLPRAKGRVALYFSYLSFLPSLWGSTASIPSCDDNAAAMGRNWSNSSGWNGGEDDGTASAFLRLYGFFTDFHKQLFCGPTALGRNAALRFILGSGASLHLLERSLIQIPVEGPPPTRTTATSPGKRKPVLEASTSTKVAAALLLTRSLPDIYALFGVLTGCDRVQYYNGSVAFTKTAQRRWAAAQSLAGLGNGAAMSLPSSLCAGVQLRNSDQDTEKGRSRGAEGEGNTAAETASLTTSPEQLLQLLLQQQRRFEIEGSAFIDGGMRAIAQKRRRVMLKRPRRSDSPHGGASRSKKQRRASTTEPHGCTTAAAAVAVANVKLAEPEVAPVSTRRPSPLPVSSSTAAPLNWFVEDGN